MNVFLGINFEFPHTLEKAYLSFSCYKNWLCHPFRRKRLKLFQTNNNNALCMFINTSQPPCSSCGSFQASVRLRPSSHHHQEILPPQGRGREDRPGRDQDQRLRQGRDQDGQVRPHREERKGSQGV